MQEDTPSASVRHARPPQDMSFIDEVLDDFSRTNSPRGYAFLFLREGDESPFRFAATFCKMFIFYQK